MSAAFCMNCSALHFTLLQISAVLPLKSQILLYSGFSQNSYAAFLENNFKNIKIISAFSSTKFHKVLNIIFLHKYII